MRSLPGIERQHHARIRRRRILADLEAALRRRLFEDEAGAVARSRHRSAAILAVLPLRLTRSRVPLLSKPRLIAPI